MAKAEIARTADEMNNVFYNLSEGAAMLRDHFLVDPDRTSKGGGFRLIDDELVPFKLSDRHAAPELGHTALETEDVSFNPGAGARHAA